MSYVPECPECGEAVADKLKGSDVWKCLECGEYYEDDRQNVELLKHKRDRLQDWDDE